MARRVTWTNNSTSYDGTEAYRDTTIDPQNLPEPIATVDPVAQGATVEYIDTTGSGDQCYAVRDFDGSGDGALSDSYCFEETTDWGQVSVGDEVEGGIYAGTITYADDREYHVVSALASGEGEGLQHKTSNTATTGTQDPDDGLSNTEAMESAGISDHPAAQHCVNYSNDGYDDWYLPSRNEVALLYNNLSGHSEFADNVSSGIHTATSTESSSDTTKAWFRKFSDGSEGAFNKNSSVRVRPIRRVPV